MYGCIYINVCICMYVHIFPSAYETASCHIFPSAYETASCYIFPSAYETASSYILTLDSALILGIVIHSYTFLSYLIAHVHAARPGCEKLIASFDCCVSVCVFFCMCPCKCVCMYVCM